MSLICTLVQRSDSPRFVLLQRFTIPLEPKGRCVVHLRKRWPPSCHLIAGLAWQLVHRHHRPLAGQARLQEKGSTLKSWARLRVVLTLTCWLVPIPQLKALPSVVSANETDDPQPISTQLLSERLPSSTRGTLTSSARPSPKPRTP